MIILCANEKGGVGKTTMATNIATMRSLDGRDVLLVDTDIQETANFWSHLRNESNKDNITTIQKYGNVKNEILALKNKFDDIIVDAGGRDTIELRSSMLVADKLISPLKPSQFDLWTLSKIHKHVSDAKIINENLKAFVLLNEASTHPKSKEKEDATEYMEEFDEISLLKTIVHNRKAYREAAKNGLAVIELQPKDEKADAEMRSLYEEIFNV